jgi:hypothetical protein
MEREHQKEKQKLLKDKDAGASAHSQFPFHTLTLSVSKKPTYEGQPDKGQDGEPGTGVTKGAPSLESETDGMGLNISERTISD